MSPVDSTKSNGKVALAESGKGFRGWAKTPPMGWNSWDCFGTTLTESQARDQAEVMAEKLKPFGWEYFTVDIQWYEPHSQGHAYKAGAPLQMDEFGRLTPALTKFPSAADGKGFKALADHVHGKGLKFGIHLMRGISKQAVKENTPVLGSSVGAADIADTQSFCPWNPDMWGVDMSKPGAQEYYNSLFELYASWGVDLVKVDDIARPYDENQKAEIEAIRKAIDRCGRPILLSLSPGDTPIQRGGHVMEHANLWRISDDFWDSWPLLYQMFERVDRWTPHRRQGTWPDADMLPFGVITFGKPTRFTRDEQVACMSLWCLARSPLILGSDMTKLDDFTLGLLTNPEVLAVNQASLENRQLFREDDRIAWVARVPASEDFYLGLFNAQFLKNPFEGNTPAFHSRKIQGPAKKDAVDISVELNGAKRMVLVTAGGPAGALDHAAWVEPVLRGPAGSKKLVELDWEDALSGGWGEVRKNLTVDFRPLTLDGNEVEGLGAHSRSYAEFMVPEGCDRFEARGIMTEGGGEQGGFEFQVLLDAEKMQLPSERPLQVDFSRLGLKGKVAVRDLWGREDLGMFEGCFRRSIPLHGAGLYRLSPQD